MTFTTIAAVRSEAGFEGNANISEDLIETYLNQAHSIVLSYTAGAYNVNDFVDTNSDFVNSQAEGFLKRAEELIAAGYLLIKLYGNEQQGIDFDGVKKKAEGEKLLLGLSDPKKPLRLINTQGFEFTRVGASSSGTIATVGIADTEPSFSLGMKF